MHQKPKKPPATISCNPSKSVEFQGPDETLELLRMGKGPILQKRDGYRFSIDALILADFMASHLITARNRRSVRYIDLGTGCGIIAILMAKWKKDLSGYGIEIQPSLADMAKRNLMLNNLEDRLQILCMDLKELPGKFPPASFDWVTINPPYRRINTGRINPNPQKAIARHELFVSLKDICEIMAYLLREKGKAFLIYPAPRITSLLIQLRAAGLEPKSLKPVYPKPGEKACWILIEAVRKGREGLIFDMPLWVEDEHGRYTEEVNKVFQWDI